MVSGIIDSHIHLYPPLVQDQPEAWAKQQGERCWINCVMPGEGARIQDWKTVEETLHDMDAAGVERCVLQGWYWQTHESCRIQNAYYEKIIRKYPDRFWAFGSINPRYPEALDEIRRLVDGGFKGIGELQAQSQGYRYQDDCFSACIETLREHRLALCLHVTEPASHPYPGKIDTPFEDFIHLGEAWPDVPIILAHLGGLLPLHVHSKRIVKVLRRFYYDLAAVPLLYRKDVINAVIHAVGTQRLLYGSDYPLRIFPKQEARAEMQRLPEWIASCKLDTSTMKAILSDNAQRLFQ